MIEGINSGFQRPLGGSLIQNPGQQLQQALSQSAESNNGEIGNFMNKAGSVSKPSESPIVQESRESAASKTLVNSADRGQLFDIRA